jgi:hypothetical protein
VVTEPSAVPRRPGRCGELGVLQRRPREDLHHHLPQRRAKVGKRVEFDPGCAKLFPFIPEIAGWRLNDNDFLRCSTPRAIRAGVQRGGERHLRGAEAGEGILFIQNPTDLGRRRRPPSR